MKTIERILMTTWITRAIARTFWALLLAALLAACSDGSDPAAPASSTVTAQDWRTFAGGPARTFYNTRETDITRDNVDQLEVLWTFPTGAIITASPTVANIELPEGRRDIIYIQSWDGFMYAIYRDSGKELWRFETRFQEVSFPNTGSAHVENVNGVDTVFFGAGERFYALNAATGAEIWTFDAGTGCRNPGDCGFRRERNQIESSPIIADGKVFFGMDIDDKERVDDPDPALAIEGGKGGFYALDAETGYLAWFFDLESGQTCYPNPGDNITRYDGYHSAATLGLPANWFETRRGCDHPRNPNGCGNVWSSAAVDFGRGRLFFASSNCDTEPEDVSFKPGPVMPPHDEAITALNFDGSVAWVWRPREIDNDDLSFGGVPNLFQISVASLPNEESITVDVVGVGNKDGTYYVMDRDGVNQRYTKNIVDHTSPDFPYWQTKVVEGGSFSGIISTAAVDQDLGRVYFSNPYQRLSDPQRPNVHALDIHTGEVLWQRDLPLGSFAPTSAIPGVVLTGSVIAKIYAFDALTGEQLYASDNIGTTSVASGVVVHKGLVLVGGGIGARHPVTGEFPDTSTQNSWIPNNVTALCVPGTASCPLPADETVD
ncbi:MAG: PQQ-binding-like beta-propeller repeat protein [Halioglobus sp.]|nr:PQQ-binding-like beta-propeller repeat protein [Halioglobus sp.]